MAVEGASKYVDFKDMKEIRRESYALLSIYMGKSRMIKILLTTEPRQAFKTAAMS
jgi:hypothetical protein